MTARPPVDDAAVLVPEPLLNGLNLLFQRMLGMRADLRDLLASLAGATPAFGEVRRLAADDVRAAVKTRFRAEAPPVAVQGLIELLASVSPWTPVCQECGELPLSNVGGSVRSLPDGSHCPFCTDGALAVAPMKLKMLAWTDGRLVDPQTTHDLRILIGERIPLTDDGILEWTDDLPHMWIAQSLYDADLPVYGLLAYLNLNRRLFASFREGVEAVREDVRRFLRRPSEFGFDRREAVEAAAREAAAFVRDREVVNTPPVSETSVDDGRPRLTVAGRTYLIEGRIGRGEHSDVFRARWDNPLTELVVIKQCRKDGDPAALEHEALTLRSLQKSTENGAELFTRLIPEYVAHDRECLVVRDKNHFDWTLSDVIREYPEGVEPQTMVWMWNRVLMLLAWVHLNKLAHADICPEHVLIHPRNHAATLIGWSKAVPFGTPLADGSTASAKTDIAMSARCMIAVLGGQNLPASIEKILQQTADAGHDDALELHEAFGKAAEKAYGPRRYHPFHLPRRS